MILASAGSFSSYTDVVDHSATVPEGEAQIVQADGDLVGWGLRRINVTKVWNSTQGGDVKVAILDTGIDWTHPDLADAVVGGICIICNSSKTASTSWRDRNGHGTAVAGVISAQRNGFGVVGASYRAELYAVKVLNDSGRGFERDVAAGLDWTVQNQMNIVVMSFSSPRYSETVAVAVQNAYSKGILLLASAGNRGESSGTIGYPAALPGVVAIGATDSSDQVPSWSSRGSGLSLVAPGVRINSTWLNGTYAQFSGTSMSVPHVAGAAALIWSAGRNLTSNQVRAILVATARDLNVTGWDNVTGFGLVDALRGVNLALNRSLDYQPVNLQVLVVNRRLSPGMTLTARISASDAGGEPVEGLGLVARMSELGRILWQYSLHTDLNGWTILNVALGAEYHAGIYNFTVSYQDGQVSLPISITNTQLRRSFSALDGSFRLLVLWISLATVSLAFRRVNRSRLGESIRG